MADPVEYMLQSIVNPKLDTAALMVVAIGVVLFVLWTITYFFKNRMLQSILLTIHEKIKLFIEKNRPVSA